MVAGEGLAEPASLLRVAQNGKRMKGKIFLQKNGKNVYINLKCEEIAAKIGYLDESDKQGGLEYSWYLGTMHFNIPLAILPPQRSSAVL